MFSRSEGQALHNFITYEKVSDNHFVLVTAYLSSVIKLEYHAHDIHHSKPDFKCLIDGT